MKAIAVTALVCCTATTLAENLTRTQEARSELGKCYSSCVDRYAKHASAAALGFTDWWAFVFSDQYANLSSSEQEATFDAFEGTYCRLYWTVLQDMRSCRDGCRDMESAYNYHSSWARNRFNRLFNAEVAEAGEIDFCDEVDLLADSEGSAGLAVATAPKRPPPRVRARPPADSTSPR